MRLISSCVVEVVVDVSLLAGLSLMLLKSRWRLLTTPSLANLDHNLQVLLIEGGESNLNNPWVFRPGICELH